MGRWFHRLYHPRRYLEKIGSIGSGSLLIGTWYKSGAVASQHVFQHYTEAILLLTPFKMATAYQEATNSPLDPKQGPEYASVMPKSYNEKDQIDGNDRSRPESPSDVSLSGPNGEEYPTNEEIVKLRRVCGKIPITSYAIAFVELCERFSYYGTTAVCEFPAVYRFDIV